MSSPPVPNAAGSRVRTPAAVRPGSTARPGVLALIGILLVAVNLRAAITGLGAVLGEVRDGLHMSGTLAGVITMLPTITFAAFGVVTPWLTRRVAPARMLIGTMALLAAGQALRVATGSPAIFIATSVVALAGIAVANVLLPGLVKQYFPAHAGLVTGAYTMSLIAGASLAAAATVPIARAAGGWRTGLGAWAVPAGVAMLAWLAVALRRGEVAGTPARAAGAVAGTVRPFRTRLGWAMAVYFGTQALGAYALMGWLAQLFRDSGYSPETAGLLLAGVTAIGAPVALLMPALAARRPNQRSWVLVLSGALVVGYLGLVAAPHAGAVLWVAMIGFGQAAFPLALGMIGMRARTPQGTVALSAFAQSVGYLIGASGPLAVGVLYEASGGWHLPIAFLLVALAIQTAAGLAAARPRFIEDPA